MKLACSWLIVAVAFAFSTPVRAAELPRSPVGAIRNKISAADLLSAESILEVYERNNGRDAQWVEGLGWLARGALLLGEREKAKRYADTTCRTCETRIAAGADLETESSLVTALGASIEVEAQLRQHSKGTRNAARYLEGQLARYSKPIGFRSRIYKRLNLLTLEGQAAPELAVEDRLGAASTSLAALEGRPVLLFVWSESCGDCKAQAAALAAVKRRYEPAGLQVVALTRYYGGEEASVEKARADSVWNDVYRDIGPIPNVFSTASMQRYGGSSTPTFIFVDRRGVVRDYLPTRLTEQELDRRVAAILR
ncbi:MAG: TlpA family protein disulfide reductase [Candidatus Eisenbacteria bacterium]|uniref:TlpA family protein disulfide reductase n=1 Tax=Eiseniibacteriota bacterium TaxID=2212470 RepID=A0A849SL54_UNCEI|nr:TlpA family protein disulfide reductase [Candidatus Eisenbacteria bacterium]